MKKTITIKRWKTGRYEEKCDLDHRRNSKVEIQKHDIYIFIMKCIRLKDFDYSRENGVGSKE